jgi:NifU-like protein
MWDYTESVVDHFVHPRNVGEIEDANGIGQVGSLACGDALKLFLKIDPQTEIIVDAKFKTFGCASAIASASALTEMVKGKSVGDAQKITNDDIAKFLGGLPEQKMHCSVMGREALDAAIANYRGEEVKPHEEKDEKIVCKCFWISEEKIRKHIVENNLETVEQVTHFTKAGGGCGGCIGDIKAILQEEVGKHARGGQTAPAKMTPIQRIALIQKVISEDIAPALAADGGAVELVDVAGNNVVVRLMGACQHCSGAKFTLQNLVQHKLREKVDAQLNVVEES